jgi:hypothetical protein
MDYRDLKYTHRLTSLIEVIDMVSLSTPSMWGIAPCSLLVESIILGLPIGNIWLERVDSHLIVFKGYGRLGAMKAFLNDEYSLTDMRYLPLYNGVRYSELPSEVKAKIREYSINLYILDENLPTKVLEDLSDRIESNRI